MHRNVACYIALALHGCTAKPIPFAINITLRNSRYPTTESWEKICSERKTMHTSAVQAPRQLLEGLASDAGIPKTSPLVAEFENRLRDDLLARGVLCDVARPCSVAVRASVHRATDLAVSVCLPSASTVGERAPIICEPYGEMWQQLGGEAYLFDSTRSRYRLALKHDSTYNGSTAGAFGAPACATFELSALARWWHRLRARVPFVHAGVLGRSSKTGKLSEGSPLGSKQCVPLRLPTAMASVAYLGRVFARYHSSSDVRLHSCVGRYKGGSATSVQRRKLGVDEMYASEFARWLRSSSSAAAAAAFRPQQFRTCAVVRARTGAPMDMHGVHGVHGVHGACMHDGTHGVWAQLSRAILT